MANASHKKSATTKTVAPKKTSAKKSARKASAKKSATKKRPTPKITREQWLQKLIAATRSKFKTTGSPLPQNIQITCGFTSHGARGQAIGECFADKASEGGAFEIFIKPDQVDSIQVAAIVVHELCHTALPLGTKHSRPFSVLALDQLGLEGKPTATVIGPRFEAWIKPILAKLGSYPHAKLNCGSKIKKQPWDALKNLRCPDVDCDYTAKARVSDLNRARLMCPVDGYMLMTRTERENWDGN